MSLLGVIQSEIESPLSETQRLGSDSRPGLIQSHHSVFESAPFSSAEQLPGGYPAFLEMSLVNGHAANSHEVFAFTDLESGCTALNDKAGYSTSASFWIDGCEYCEEIGGARVGSPFLVAINDVVITVS